MIVDTGAYYLNLVTYTFDALDSNTERAIKALQGR
jgi:hypothetical protein